MLSRDSYLIAKKFGYYFVGLDKNNRLTLWNSITGKPIKIIEKAEFRDINGKPINDFSFNGYDVFTDQNGDDDTYKREWS
jgi:hypothetical protein